MARTKADPVQLRRKALEDQIREERGQITARDEAILDMYCEVERERLEAVAAVQSRGMIEQPIGGRGTRVKVENKAFPQVLRTSREAARLLNELFRAIRKPTGGDADDEPDADELDDY